MNETMESILGRRSTRKYRPEQITDEQLNLILQAATYAPSGSNSQSWLFTAVQSKRILADLNELIRQGTKEGDIRVETPLIGLKKREIVRLGVELAAPFHVSWSCYSGEKEACGVCESCVLRLRAFREAGAVDPIPYAGTKSASNI